MITENVVINTTLNSQNIKIEIDVDGIKTTASIKLPNKFHVNQTLNFESLISAWYGIFFGQLYFAKKIVIASTCSEEVLRSSFALLKILYQVRCLLDGLKPFVPEVVLQRPVSLKKPDDFSNSSSLKKALSVWSGGLDSTLSTLLLKENFNQVYGLHFTINEDSKESERVSVNTLSKSLDISTEFIQFDFPEYISIAKKFSRKLAVFPNHNSVPHGRELLLIPIICQFAISRGISKISLGHDYYSSTTQISLNSGALIPRFDTQSSYCMFIINRIVQDLLNPNLLLFSPSAAYTDFAKLDFMHRNAPKVLADCMSCHWGNWCGLCSKCSRYFLIQRSLGNEIILFKNNPLKNKKSYLFSLFNDFDEISKWDKSALDLQIAMEMIIHQRRFSSEDRLVRDYLSANELLNYEQLIKVKNELLELKINDDFLIPENFVFSYEGNQK